MKKNKLLKVLTFIGTGMLSMSMLAGCAGNSTPQAGNNNTASEQPKAPADGGKYIVMGTNAEFEPFEYREGSEIVGFDVEIAKAIAAKAGKELKIEDMEFGTLIVGLNNNQMDFIAAGMSVTEERKTQVDFSNPYFTSKQVIIVKADDGSIQTADDLVGKKVGVQLGTTGDLFVSGTDGVEVLQFDKAPLAVMELKNGKVDAVVIDAEPAKRLVEGQDDIKVLDAPFTEEEYAIAVRKGDKELLDLINSVIEELKQNGEYDKIFEKFFDVEE
ncbi:basic amino acid ABC transporter substrate-binding protein [Cellulosilyticum sp. I15G10I2]|uniref:basic amino acid ABC transporter substrate-binding protein n=1 Tax=Cellulosilyticum sp. I15G10I2 TaxID=1892843 RepID=UPI00085BB640|nr:basic amino acid ABC transporter substrate-binding protein [Cellulosilyticum sp. I15G10I2]